MAYCQPGGSAALRAPEAAARSRSIRPSVPASRPRGGFSCCADRISASMISTARSFCFATDQPGDPIPDAPGALVGSHAPHPIRHFCLTQGSPDLGVKQPGVTDIRALTGTSR